ENTAPWLLKEEMRRTGSLLIEIARQCAVPAGHALAVDRVEFSAKVTATISHEPLVNVHREEVTAISEDEITIVCTGPLTSDALAQEIARLSTTSVARTFLSEPDSGLSPEISRTRMSDPHGQLYFYDSISPIVESDSIDMSKVYLAARYDKGTADYINCPMTHEEYGCFYDALMEAQSVEGKDWEKLNYFEACLPIEEIARRGRE